LSLRYSDYKEISFTDTETRYEIGEVNGTKFVSVNTLFLATEDCLINFNGDGFWQKLYKNDYYHFERKLYVIRVKRITTNGNLELWAEGNSER